MCAKRTETKELALSAFCLDISPTQICQDLGLSQRTFHYWKSAGNWDAKKAQILKLAEAQGEAYVARQKRILNLLLTQFAQLLEGGELKPTISDGLNALKLEQLLRGVAVAEQNSSEVLTAEMFAEAAEKSREERRAQTAKLAKENGAVGANQQPQPEATPEPEPEQPKAEPKKQEPEPQPGAEEPRHEEKPKKRSDSNVLFDFV